MPRFCGLVPSLLFHPHTSLLIVLVEATSLPLPSATILFLVHPSPPILSITTLPCSPCLPLNFPCPRAVSPRPCSLLFFVPQPLLYYRTLACRRHLFLLSSHQPSPPRWSSLYLVIYIPLASSALLGNLPSPHSLALSLAPLLLSRCVCSSWYRSRRSPLSHAYVVPSSSRRQHHEEASLNADSSPLGHPQR